MKSENFDCHFSASTIAALINFPLWRASAMAQSGFVVQSGETLASKYWAAIQPPYKGALATVGGMAWARGFIFGGSEYGRKWMKTTMGVQNEAVLATAPALLSSTFVQIANQPLIRSTIMLQNPAYSDKLHNVRSALFEIYRTRGVGGMWHGTSAGILKTVPKYTVAIMVKDWMESALPKTQEGESGIMRSAVKAVVAGICGAGLTNPLDVLRNEMFKTDLALTVAARKLSEENGVKWLYRGMAKNMVAVAVPVAATIFFTDIFVSLKNSQASQAR